VIRQKYRPDGGAERFVGSLLSVFKHQPCRVTLITRKWQADADQAVITCNPPRLGRIMRDWGFALAVRRELKRHRFDLVQCAERIDCCDLYRAGDGVHREWLRQRRRIQSLPARWLTALSLYHAYLKHAEKRLFESPRLRAVICNSRMVRDEILSDFDVDPAKLRVIYTGVDTDRFSPELRRHRTAVRGELGIPEQAAAFVFVGSGFERKGLGQAIRALARLADGHLIVVGKEKRMGSYRSRVARLGLEGRVHLLGVRRDVGPYYGAADALVLPTLYDPFPNVALEAMAAGLPIATSTKCGAAELIEPGRNGYVCDALDGEALAAAMRRLSDREHCRRLGDQARQTVMPYTLDAMRDHLNRLYMEMLHD
jgi:UDP-glucose:(heptosyl)LPS alpha-1,3-glucosyltransferase